MKQIINGADLRRMIISAAAAIEINKQLFCFFCSFLFLELFLFFRKSSSIFLLFRSFFRFDGSRLLVSLSRTSSPRSFRLVRSILRILSGFFIENCINEVILLHPLETFYFKV